MILHLFLDRHRRRRLNAILRRRDRRLLRRLEARKLRVVFWEDDSPEAMSGTVVTWRDVEEVFRGRR